MFKLLLESFVLIILIRPLFYIDRTRSTSTNAFVIQPTNPKVFHMYRYYDLTATSIITTTTPSSTTPVMTSLSVLHLSTSSSTSSNNDTSQQTNENVIVDYDRAKFCVNNFGTCTLAEMESIKESMSFR
jgi:hypothetical protein